MNYKIFWKNIDEQALEQFFSAMNNDFVVKWALMADAHSWYSLPIWWVVATKWVVVPAWIWFDIWCWVCALKTDFKKQQIEKHTEKIFNSIQRIIPLWEWKFYNQKQEWNYFDISRTSFLDRLMSDKWLYQIWTLWWWNHFLEISYDENENIWIVVHSWSRWVWHQVWTHYMKLAKNEQVSKIKIDFTEFEAKYSKLKSIDLEKYSEIKAQYEQKQEKLKWIEWHNWFDVESENWKNYLIDMNFCLEFALESRKIMIKKIFKEISYYLNWEKIEIDLENSLFINKNHNHCEFEDWMYIHRKWATHAKKWMLWIIPWNMRDWSFVVEWKWNTDSLCSCSHWAWRVMSREKAKHNIKFEDFKKSMNWILAKVDEKTVDESPFAYKDIFEVIDLQKDLLWVKYYLKPIINLKW